jgi:hypothetical protein
MKTKTFNKPKPKPRDDFWDREPRKSAIGGTVTESFFKGGY